MTNAEERILSDLEALSQVRETGIPPEWMRRGDVRRVFAIGQDVLDDWAANGIVEAHKIHPGKNGTVVFRVSDIRKAIQGTPIYLAIKREVERNQTHETER